VPSCLPAESPCSGTRPDVAPAEIADPDATDPEVARPDVAVPEAVEFVRFCRARRRVGWPELYDEMILVACRGYFRGYGFDELAERGIGFSLTELPRLAALVGRVAAEEQPPVRVGAARRGRAVIGGTVGDRDPGSGPAGQERGSGGAPLGAGAAPGRPVAVRAVAAG